MTILKRHLADKEARLEIMTTRCQNAEMSLAEVQKSLDEFIDVLSIKPEEVQLTGLKLGSGSYAGIQKISSLVDSQTIINDFI